MAIVDKPRRVLLRAVRPCAEVEDIILNEADCMAGLDVKWEQGAMLKNTGLIESERECWNELSN